MKMNLSTSSEKSDHIEKLQELYDKIMRVQNECQGTDGLQTVQEIIEESSKIAEESTSFNEMIVDAKILHTGTNIVSSHVSSLNTNLTSFNESKYIGGLATFLEQNSSQRLSSESEWACFAPLTYHLFRKSHPVTYMLGMLALEPPPPKERAKAEKREKKGAEAQKNVLSSLKEKEKTETEEEESNIYRHILKCLVNQYKKNHRTPVSYFNFIVDPTSYWRTVENIFHFAFLVRDGVIRMEIKKGLPYVEPVQKREGNVGQKSCSNQFCLTLSVTDWKRCVEKFKIESPSIPPYAKKR